MRVASLQDSDRKMAKLYVDYNQRFGLTRRKLDTVNNARLAEDLVKYDADGEVVGEPQANCTEICVPL